MTPKQIRLIIISTMILNISVASALYYVLGRPGARDVPLPDHVAKQYATIHQLIEKLQHNPQDYDGWIALKSAYLSLDKQDEAQLIELHLATLKRG